MTDWPKINREAASVPGGVPSDLHRIADSLETLAAECGTNPD